MFIHLWEPACATHFTSLSPTLFLFVITCAWSTAYLYANENFLLGGKTSKTSFLLRIPTHLFIARKLSVVDQMNGLSFFYVTLLSLLWVEKKNRMSQLSLYFSILNLFAFILFLQKKCLLSLWQINCQWNKFVVFESTRKARHWESDDKSENQAL